MAKVLQVAFVLAIALLAAGCSAVDKGSLSYKAGYDYGAGDEPPDNVIDCIGFGEGWASGYVRDFGGDGEQVRKEAKAGCRDGAGS